MSGLVIAIDGPAGAGKSTAARGLAAALGYTYVDTGALYRAVAFAARRAGVDLDDGPAVAPLVGRVALRPEAGVTRVYLDDADVTDDIRAAEMSAFASRVAAQPAVRAALLGRQRAFAEAGGVVMDGRDIGTVVFPDAQCKFFLIATTEERARRRHAEDTARGGTNDANATRAAIEERDRRDRERAVAPLRAAPDAITIDTSTLTSDEVVARMLERVRARAKA
jgi:cytidylate kinase